MPPSQRCDYCNKVKYGLIKWVDNTRACGDCARQQFASVREPQNQLPILMSKYTAAAEGIISTLQELVDLCEEEKEK